MFSRDLRERRGDKSTPKRTLGIYFEIEASDNAESIQTPVERQEKVGCEIDMDELAVRQHNLKPNHIITPLTVTLT